MDVGIFTPIEHCDRGSHGNGVIESFASGKEEEKLVQRYAVTDARAATGRIAPTVTLERIDSGARLTGETRPRCYRPLGVPYRKRLKPNPRAA